EARHRLLAGVSAEDEGENDQQAYRRHADGPHRQARRLGEADIAPELAPPRLDRFASKQHQAVSPSTAAVVANGPRVAPVMSVTVPRSTMSTRSAPCTAACR